MAYRRAGALHACATALLLASCVAGGTMVEAPLYVPTATASATGTAVATPAWWTTVAAAMCTPLPTLTVPTPAAGAGASGQPPDLKLPTGFPSLSILATVTPVAYESLAGKILFRTIQEGGERIYLLDPATGERQPVYPREQDFLGDLAQALYDEALAKQTLSPDGGHQVYVQDAWGRAQLYIRRLSDGASWQLTELGAGIAYDPAWQPGGDLILFCATESGNDEIWLIRADGTGARQLTHNSWEWDKHPSWSPDGSQIVFYSNRAGRRQLYVMASDGSEQRLLSEAPGEDYDPLWVR